MDVEDEEEAEQLQRAAQRVAEAVRSEGSLNAGGKFEWVESVLVKVSRRCQNAAVVFVRCSQRWEAFGLDGSFQW